MPDFGGPGLGREGSSRGGLGGWLLVRKVFGKGEALLAIAFFCGLVNGEETAIGLGRGGLSRAFRFGDPAF